MSMSSDMMLEAGWPAHCATYEGRSYEAICADMRIIEEGMVGGMAPGDAARYAALCEEWRAHPVTMDEGQAAVAELTRLLKAERVRLEAKEAK